MLGAASVGAAVATKEVVEKNKEEGTLRLNSCKNFSGQRRRIDYFTFR